MLLNDPGIVKPVPGMIAGGYRTCYLGTRVPLVIDCGYALQMPDTACLTGAYKQVPVLVKFEGGVKPPGPVKDFFPEQGAYDRDIICKKQKGVVEVI